ncbi:MAG: hypothetical protein E7124_00670 [Bacteroidales bacterium]|nr:hypothetical protein [Bacteroidales bacterium]
MTITGKSDKYRWNFENIGGTTRVKITSGDDIAHLSELDPKMWTVLSCPVKGLEIDEKSLLYMDCDGDGKLRINDVICTSRWITGILKNTDLILNGADSIDIEEINQESDCGKKLYKAARQILNNLGKDGSEVSLADTADIAAVFAKTRFNGDGVITEASSDDADEKAAIAAAVASTGGALDRSGVQGVNAEHIEAFYQALAAYASWQAAAVEAPYGDKTDAVIAAYKALDAKVKDHFMRSELALFSPESMSSLDVQTSRIEAISAENLTIKSEEIAAYPLVRITGKSEIDLSAPVNPAWKAQFDTVITAACPDKKVLNLEDWNAVGVSFAAYEGWKNAKAGACVEALGLDAVKVLLEQDKKAALLELVAQDAALAEESSNIDMVDKFLHVYRDFYRLLRNFVTFHDFYDKDKKVKAIFQAGRLLVDQRECRFCMNVADMGKHSAAAASSGMYLIYCDCTTKTKPGKISIVAAMTVGEVGDIFVGKNVVYYDEHDLEWDAVITKIVDNPISIAQAFWSPYRRMATAVENLINKNAADKDAKIMKDATAKINATPAAVPAGGAAPVKPAEAAPFDIGKFAGIFAALGMAVGMIGTALASLAKGIFALKWWQVILAFVGVMLVISGPAMVMAWLKLRRRNIAPLLNANGWAINAASKISIPFGETLTEIAKYPTVKLKDPYARKGLAPWKAWLVSLSSLIVVLAVLWVFNLFAWAGLKSPLPRYNKPEQVEVVVEEVVEIIDTLTVK